MTQTERLYEHLKEGRAVTDLDALEELGIRRLSARVWDLKKAGINVGDRWITVENRYGEDVKVKEYYLETKVVVVVDEEGYSFEKSLAEAKERSPQFFLNL